jgi:hypothetical protein
LADDGLADDGLADDGLADDGLIDAVSGNAEPGMIPIKYVTDRFEF